ncbi:Protein-arginine deiminase [Metarhizium album ARSEF 1941]|uniref:Protein-arginine deiminase n=1 Tax=Metarhizium album (strain ARSEF 1941) TaxID=1081103 RepID=A0A0B2WQ01_METAS|nr:Protein-arginine deiminase [Metarhizium album ARSEF 1941]KHN95704.1 Protein-arginine deiminase [Metarhizium album ARSEF 1941]
MKSAPLMLAGLAGLTSLAVAGPINGRQARPTKEELFVRTTYPPTKTDVQAPFEADIRVDTNRDGVVDVQGSSDTEGKNKCTETSGAIFLANLGDSGGRCKQLGPSKNPRTPRATLAKCHDADGDEQHAPQNMAPILTVPIQGLSKSATATVTVSDAQVRPLVRIFVARSDGSWEIVNNNTVFSAEEIKKGLTLGIDARDTRRAGGWDGRVSVDFTIKDGGATSKDTVCLRVAPVLLQHHRQPVQKVFASSFPGLTGKMKALVEGIMKGIEDSMQKAQVPGPLTRLPTKDLWAQDYFEPGYTSMPGPNGTVISLRVMIEGRRNYFDSARLIYTHLRGDGVGGFRAQSRDDFNPWDEPFEAGGNMETIPPYEFNGKKFPAGRVVVGGNAARLPRIVDFFRAQETQDPIVLDSTWLSVKHVDEMIQFLPAKTKRGWIMMAVDPQMGLTQLRQAQKYGFGGQPVINQQKVKSGPTIDEFLARRSNIKATEMSAKYMKANIEHIKNETGLTDAEIFLLPMLVGVDDEVHHYIRPSSKRQRSVVERRDNETNSASSQEGLDAEFFEDIDIHGPGGDSDHDTTTVQRRQWQPSKPVHFDSYLPSLVNGVPLSYRHVLVPKPFGPLINGHDIFEIVTKSVYKKAGVAIVHFLDGWQFHKYSGDFHCMTNTFRDTSAPWWLKPL